MSTYHETKDGTSTNSAQAAPVYGIQWVDIDTGREVGQDWVAGHESSKYVAFNEYTHKRRSTLSLFDRLRWWSTSAKKGNTIDGELRSSFLDHDHGDVESPSGHRAMKDMSARDGQGFKPDEFVLTGTAFDYLKANEPHLLGKILFDVRIFARFSPEQKAEVSRLPTSLCIFFFFLFATAYNLSIVWLGRFELIYFIFIFIFFD